MHLTSKQHKEYLGAVVLMLYLTARSQTDVPLGLFRRRPLRWPPVLFELAEMNRVSRGTRIGFYLARKASLLNPIDAFWHE